MGEKVVWTQLQPGTVFLFDGQRYLIIRGERFISLVDYAEASLHKDVKVEPLGYFDEVY